MYVCLCKGITDGQIRAAVEDGAANLQQVSHRLGVARQCGKCACLAKSVIDTARNPPADYVPTGYYPAI